MWSNFLNKIPCFSDTKEYKFFGGKFNADSGSVQFLNEENFKVENLDKSPKIFKQCFIFLTQLCCILLTAVILNFLIYGFSNVNFKQNPKIMSSFCFEKMENEILEYKKVSL